MDYKNTVYKELVKRIYLGLKEIYKSTSQNTTISRIARLKMPGFKKSIYRRTGIQRNFKYNEKKGLSATKNLRKSGTNS